MVDPKLAIVAPIICLLLVGMGFIVAGLLRLSATRKHPAEFAILTVCAVALWAVGLWVLHTAGQTMEWELSFTVSYGIAFYVSWRLNLLRAIDKTRANESTR